MYRPRRITAVFTVLILFSTALISLGAFSLEEDILQRSQRFLGTPYVYGGESPSGFDCSGFVYYLFHQHVSSWPRGTRGQASKGTVVSKGELRPGDLTFWATGSDPNRITHVSLYLGNNSMIHALSEGPRRGITVSDMDSRYWRPKYLFSRRIFPAAGGEGGREGGGSSGTIAETETGKIYERIYPRGKYSGELSGGQPSGQGTITLNNGDVYVGAFRAGQFHGRGRYTALDGTVYQGEFAEGYLHGRAVRIWPSGSRYEGEYSEGRETGGWFTSSSGTRRWVVRKDDGTWEVYEDRRQSVSVSAPAEVSTPERESSLDYVHRDNPWDDRQGVADIPAEWESEALFQKVWQAEMDDFEAVRRAEEEAFKAYRNGGN